MQPLTNSRRTSFGSCHRKHYYAYELKRRPATTSEPLRFGTMAHAALEIWWAGGDLTECLSALDSCDDAYMHAMAVAVITAYDSHWRMARDAITTIAVECEYSAPLLNPRTGKSSQTFELRGKIDAVALLPAGQTVIVEHKTTSADIEVGAKYWDKLAIDGQVSGYLIGAQTLGHNVDECLYDVLRKPGIAPLKATPEENRKYTKEGKLYANQRLENETPSDFGLRCLEVISSDPAKYFQRRFIGRRDGDIIEYFEDMWSIAREIRASQLTNSWPRNPGACDQWSGCEYFDVCAGRDYIDGPSFATTTINPELSC